MTAIIEINIGLEVRNAGNSVQERNDRATQAVTYLIEQFCREAVQTRRALVQYEGPEGLVAEDTLIARLELSTVSVALRRLTYLMYRMAQNLGQDCVSVYWVNLGIGRLIGPEAASWSSFDLDYFTPFGDAEPDVERTAA